MAYKRETNKAPIEGQPNQSLPEKPGVKKRKTRLDARNVFSVRNRDPNFVYRYVLDEGPRVADRFDRGWEYAPREDDGVVGDDRVNAGHAVDGRQTVRSGDKLLVLMRIPKEYWDEDHEIYCQEQDEIERSLNRHDVEKEGTDGLKGTVSVGRGRG